MAKNRRDFSVHLEAIFQAQALPPSMFILGPPQSGKWFELNQVLGQCPSIKTAQVSCQAGTVHPRLLFESILAQLHEQPRVTGNGFAAPFKCDSLVGFVEHLQEHEKELEIGRGAGKGAVIVMKKAEKLRDVDASLLPGLFRLQDLTKLNVCVVMLTHIPYNKFLIPQGLQRPITLTLPEFSESELALVIAQELLEAHESEKENHVRVKEGDKKVTLELEFFTNYANLIISLCHFHCNTLSKLIGLAKSHVHLYKSPVLEGTVEQDNVRALYRQIEKPIKEALNTIHVREKASRQFLIATERSAAADSSMRKRVHVELPFYSKFLLIAAYLASYNPVKSDRRFFVKHHGKQKKTTAMLKAKDKRISSQLTGPKAFPLDRMLAIFYSIVDDADINPTANIMSQISSLVTLQFITQTSAGDCLDQPKYKCLANLECVNTLSKQVDFELHRYLYDFQC